MLADQTLIEKRQYRIIEDVLEFKKRSEELIARVFLEKEDYENFILSLKDAFIYFLNLNSNQSAEFLAKFLDIHLKKSTTSAAQGGDEALEELIKEVI